MAEIGSVIDGKYRILRETGRGGMAIVYAAMDVRLNCLWAVKEIRTGDGTKQDDLAVQSLIAETNLMKHLDHPALPRIVDIIEEETGIYVVMDYIEGESLDRLIAREGPLDEKQVIDWAIQIADALNYLHAQDPPIIYRDMKPANLMLRPDGRIKIVDFGIAKEYKEEKKRDTATLGTRGYAPPEQYNGRTDPRSDIYALGMTMYHMLTGVDPGNQGEYIPARELCPNLSEGIETIIHRCVQPLPEQRYQTCGELMEDLNHPEDLTKDRMLKQQRRISLFAWSFLFAVIFFIVGLVTRNIAIDMKNVRYDELTTVLEDESVSSQVERYMEAAQIYPDRLKAYTMILDTYENQGFFGSVESDAYQALYYANKHTFDEDREGVFALNYQSGRVYLNQYYESDHEADIRIRMQKAYSFFEDNHLHTEEGALMEKQGLSEMFYELSSFYRVFVLNGPDGEEAEESDYAQLFGMIAEAMESFDQEEEYDQMTLYHTVLMVLQDQYEGIQRVMPEDKTAVILFDWAYEKAMSLHPEEAVTRTLYSDSQKLYEEFNDKVGATE